MAAMMNMMNPQMMMQMQKMMQSQGMQMPAGMNFQQMQKNMVNRISILITAYISWSSISGLFIKKCKIDLK